jgi:hypothetical protein
MVSTAVAAAVDGLEDRKFECMKCGHAETRRMTADPLASRLALAWTEGSLKPPQ